jgi:hypothetical protein
MSGIGKTFIEDFTNRVVDNSSRFEQIELRLRRIEKYLGQSGAGKHFICVFCRQDYGGRVTYHGIEKTLYCDKCDSLQCHRHYCQHLRGFINSIKN